MNPTVPVVLHLLQSLSIEQVLVLQVGLLIGFWELCIGADLKERESVIAWEMVKEQGLRVVLLGRANCFPWQHQSVGARGFVGTCCSYLKLRKLQVSV